MVCYPLDRLKRHPNWTPRPQDQIVHLYEENVSNIINIRFYSVFSSTILRQRQPAA